MAIMEFVNKNGKNRLHNSYINIAKMNKQCKINASITNMPKMQLYSNNEHIKNTSTNSR